MSLSKDESEVGWKINDVMRGRRCVCDRHVSITEHFLKLLLNFAVCLRVGTQQMKDPVHGCCCSIMSLHNEGSQMQKLQHFSCII